MERKLIRDHRNGGEIVGANSFFKGDKMIGREELPASYSPTARRVTTSDRGD
jgi:hypothetical protein